MNLVPVGGDVRRLILGRRRKLEPPYVGTYGSRFQCARLKEGHSAWSDVFPMADTPNLPDCNPVLFVGPDQELWLFWIAVPAERWEDSLLRFRKARDTFQPAADSGRSIKQVSLDPDWIKTANTAK
jgi:hypothetical protein